MQAHIHLDEKIDTLYAILPGDPGRIDRITPFLDDCEEICFNREYRSVTGYYKGIKVLAMSTGMGGVSTSIAVEELARIGVTTLIRIGSCGALSGDVAVGDLVISCGCVRDDGTSHAYIRDTYPAVPDTGLLFAVMQAASDLGCPHHVGITRSHESFYAEAEIAQEEYWKQQNVLCDDMETAPLFVVGRLRGVKCASILNNVVEAGGNAEESVASYSMGGVASGNLDCAAGNSASVQLDCAAGNPSNAPGSGAPGISPAMTGERNEILVALEAIAKMEATSKGM